jgi:hypothetical protein
VLGTGKAYQQKPLKLEDSGAAGHNSSKECRNSNVWWK